MKHSMPSVISKPKKVTRPKDPQISSLEEKLRKTLGTKIRIKTRGKKGKIEIEYSSLNELDRLLDLLLG